MPRAPTQSQQHQIPIILLNPKLRSSRLLWANRLRFASPVRELLVLPSLTALPRNPGLVGTHFWWSVSDRLKVGPPRARDRSLGANTIDASGLITALPAPLRNAFVGRRC